MRLSLAQLIYHTLRHINYITVKIFRGNEIARRTHYRTEQPTSVFPELKPKTEDLQEVAPQLSDLKFLVSLGHLSLTATESKHSVTFVHKDFKALQQVKYFLLEEAAERQILAASTYSAGDTRSGERLALLYWVKWAPGANCTQQYSTKLQGRGGQSWLSGTDLPLPNSKTAESHVHFACGRSRKCGGRAKSALPSYRFSESLEVIMLDFSLFFLCSFLFFFLSESFVFIFTRFVVHRMKLIL